MKKTFKFLITGIIAISALFLASCSSNGDSGSDSSLGNVVDEWKVVYDSDYNSYDPSFKSLVFYDNNKVKFVWEDKEAVCNWEKVSDTERKISGKAKVNKDVTYEFRDKSKFTIGAYDNEQLNELNVTYYATSGDTVMHWLVAYLKKIN